MSVLGNNQLFLSTDGSYTIPRSLRLRSSASAYLNRTSTSSLTSTYKWTYSAWVKRGTLGVVQYILNGPSGANGNYIAQCYFNNDDTIILYEPGSSFGGGNGGYFKTNQVFRDVSSWYHILIAEDATSPFIKLYVNGVQVTSFSTYTAPTTNVATKFSVASSGQFIGAYYNGANNFDGYLAEANFIDGQALTPSSFGQNDPVTGVWQPIKYSGTYGTNGFYLPFSDNSSTTNIALDKSGNGNNWTANNISLTAGVNYDSMLDVPTLTSATAANYCTLNPLTPSGATSNGNLTATSSGVGMFTTIQLPTTGKWYAEFNPSAYWNTGSYLVYGAMAVANAAGTYSGLLATTNASNGGIYQNGSFNQAFTTWATTDVIGLAVDRGANTVQVYRNGSALGSALTLPTGDLWFFVSAYSGGNVINTNFGQQPFTYTPPTGFVALNTFNLPDSTIKAGNKYFDATAYTGTGAAQNILNAAGFQPDFVWAKVRNTTQSNNLYDSVRGVQKTLYSDLTNVEATDVNGLTSFNSNGFSVGSSNGVNYNGGTLVAWQWKAGNGSSSNTNGSITSTVSVNAAAGFSILTFNVPSSGPQTVGHGLGVAPKFMIFKSRDSATNQWVVYHASIGATNYLFLSRTDASAASSTVWNNTAPTSSVLTLGSGFVQANYGNLAVMYCWAEVAGFSKFGSYTGNGSTDGAFVYTGFRPKFVMVKRTDTVSAWTIHDTSRSTYNVIGDALYADQSTAEVSSTRLMDFLSNGFKNRENNADSNASGGTYIYAAFAENPFKNSLAR